MFHSSDLPFLMFSCSSAACSAQAPPGWLHCGCSIKIRAGCHIFLSLQLAHDWSIAEHSIYFTDQLYNSHLFKSGLLIPPSLPLTISIYIYNLPWIIISHIFYFSLLAVPSPRQGVTEPVVLCLDVFSPAVIYIAIQKVSGFTSYSPTSTRVVIGGTLTSFCGFHWNPGYDPWNPGVGIRQPLGLLPCRRQLSHFQYYGTDSYIYKSLTLPRIAQQNQCMSMEIKKRIFESAQVLFWKVKQTVQLLMLILIQP